tara:strand:+ start:97 stop:237 length:141 start_codon:yes stop_codon:yes gene_type:complete
MYPLGLIWVDLNKCDKIVGNKKSLDLTKDLVVSIGVGTAGFEPATP